MRRAPLLVAALIPLAAPPLGRAAQAPARQGVPRLPQFGIETAVVRVLRAPVGGRNAALIVTFRRDAAPSGRAVTLTLNGQVMRFRDDGQGVDQVAGDGRFSAPATVPLDELRLEQRRALAAARAGAKPVVFRDRVLAPRVDFDTSIAGVPTVDDLIKALRAREFVVPRRVGSIIPLFPFTTIDPATIDFARSLVITDTGVTRDPGRTFDVCTGTGNANGVWTFKHAMTGLANQPVTGIAPAQFVRRWLRRWELTLVVNDVPSLSRPGMVAFIQKWQNASGGPAAPLNLDKAPFRLLAIVNRIDLRENLTYGSGSAGEGRLVFGGVDPANPCSHVLFTVIFEYGVRRNGCLGLKAWAQQWMDLKNNAPGTAAYNTALEAITEQFVAANTNPAQLPNRSSLNQLRTNEILSAPWQLREFRLAGEDVDVGHLRQVVVKQTPRDTLNNSTVLANYISSAQAQIAAGTNVVPAEFPVPPGDPFLGSESNAPPVPGGFWDGPPPPPSVAVDSSVREKLSFNTCNGCHTSETATGFTHIKPEFPPGSPGSLSAFLRGPISVTDPAGERDPANPANTKVRNFDEPLRRQQSMANVLGQSCFRQILFRPTLAVH